MDKSENQCIIGHYIQGNDTSLRIPKVIARIKLCGGALTFNFYDTDTAFEMPTKEQCENLKKTFGIEVELVNENEEADV